MSKIFKYINLQITSIKTKKFNFLKKNIRRYKIRKFKAKFILVSTFICTVLTLGAKVLVNKPLLICFVVLLCFFSYNNITKFSLNLNPKVLLILIFLFKDSLEGLFLCNYSTCLAVTFISFVLYMNFYALLIKK